MMRRRGVLLAYAQDRIKRVPQDLHILAFYPPDWIEICSNQAVLATGEEGDGDPEPGALVRGMGAWV